MKSLIFQSVPFMILFSYLRRLRRKQGASLMEYGILIGLIGVLSIGAINGVGGEVVALFDKVRQPLLRVLDPSYRSPAKLQWSQQGLTFESTPQRLQQHTLQLRNTGESASQPLDMAVVGAGFEIVSNSCGSVLAGEMACDVVVRYAPMENGTSAGQLTSAAPTVSLAGTAQGFDPALAWNMLTPFAIEAVQNPQTEDQTLTLTNMGYGRSPIPTIAISGAGFSLEENTCTEGLERQQSCSAVVRFTASQDGTYQGRLSAGDLAPQTLTATAQGFVPRWEWEPSVDTFTIVASAGNTTQNRSYVVRNNGLIAGVSPTPQLSGHSAFQIASSTCNGQVLAPQEMCATNVVYAPNDNVYGQTATLTQGSLSKNLTGSGSNFYEQWTWTMESTSMNATIPNAGAGRYVQLRNTGTYTSPFRLQFSGTRPDQFEIFQEDPAYLGCLAKPLSSNGVCRFQVRLKAGTTSGSFSASVTAISERGTTAVSPVWSATRSP